MNNYLIIFDDHPKWKDVLITPRTILRMRVKKEELLSWRKGSSQRQSRIRILSFDAKSYWHSHMFLRKMSRCEEASDLLMVVPSENAASRPRIAGFSMDHWYTCLICRLGQVTPALEDVAQLTCSLCLRKQMLWRSPRGRWSSEVEVPNCCNDQGNQHMRRGWGFFDKDVGQQLKFFVEAFLSY